MRSWWMLLAGCAVLGCDLGGNVGDRKGAGGRNVREEWDGSPLDGLVGDGALPDGPPLDGAAPDVAQRETRLDMAFDGPRSDGPVSDGPLPDGRMLDGPLPDGPVSDGPLPDGPLPDGQVPDGALPDGPPPDGPLPDGPLPDGPMPDGPLPDGPLPDMAPAGPCNGGCGDGLRCLGEVCSCTFELHGDAALRGDGSVAYPSTGAVVSREDSGEPLVGLTEVFDGQNHGCARREDATVWCWSKGAANPNRNGELGNGTPGVSPPAWQAGQVMVAEGEPLIDVARLAGGSSGCYLVSTTCAIDAGGALWCWGVGGNGGGGSVFSDGLQQAHPWATAILADAETPLDGVEAVSLGRRHACALRNGGQVWCWGSGIGGALGQGDEAAHQYPVQVELPAPAAQVGAGADATCARIGGGVWCWGSNNSGQVGVGVPADHHEGCINFCVTRPAQVVTGPDAPLDGVDELDVAYLAVCARRADATLWCWGAQITNVAAPISVRGEPVVDVVEYSACGAGRVDTALRVLTVDDALRLGGTLTEQACP